MAKCGLISYLNLRIFNKGKMWEPTVVACRKPLFLGHVRLFVSLCLDKCK